LFNVELAQLAEELSLEYSGKKPFFVDNVVIDSRKITDGSLFIALKGENTDGHLFIKSLSDNAGNFAVAIDNDKYFSPKLNMINGTDNQEFLKKLASYQRNLFTGKVIGITGSSGKTSTKDILQAVLSEKFATLKTEGNYNNEIGLPLTISGLQREHQALVLEMGMRGLGQIYELSNIARPDYAIITNIGHVHAELLGSIEKIAQAKAEIFAGVKEGGTAFLNADARELIEPFLEKHISQKNIQVQWFGKEKFCNPRLLEIGKKDDRKTEFSIAYHNEKKTFTINLSGEHNVFNALPVIGVAKEMGLTWSEIDKGLRTVSLSKMRQEVIKTKKGITILNDCYNANPESVLAALSNLSVYPQRRKILVLGDMYELGVYEKEKHREIGNAVAGIEHDLLITIGSLAAMIAEQALSEGCKKEKVLVCANNREASSYLHKYLHSGDLVLIKGSRGVRMEEIVSELLR